MPYSGTTLDQFTTLISSLIEDTGQRYWVLPEIQLATYEALLYWGACTSYYRSRGVLPLTPNHSPFYDLAIELPSLRTRLWTLDRMVREVQYHLLEAPSGIAGTGMSGQVDVAAILQSIQVARNRFVLDTHLPYSVHTAFGSPPPPEGMIEFDQKSIYVHRASWMDSSSGTWTNLWREDAWAVDKGNVLWTTQPGNPQQYSESENAPLKLQLSPPPINEGTLEAVTVDSLQLDLTNPNATFGVPDEWVHAIKYGALSYLLSGEGQIKDMVRADYAEKRYTQSVDLAKDARSVIRLLVNNVPVPFDSLAAIDAGSPYWRNQIGPPQVAGALYDMVVVGPVDQLYGGAIDIVQSAPLPNSNDYIQVGAEDLDTLSDYIQHVLTFKCGGNDFKSSFGGYENFMRAVAERKGINTAKIRYLLPLMGQAQKEWAVRPDKITLSK